MSATHTPDERREVYVTTLEHEVIAEVVEELAHCEDLYQRGGALVHVLREESTPLRPAGAPRIADVPSAHLRTLISERVSFVKVTEKVSKKTGDVTTEEKPAHPPDWCVKGIHARGSWPGIRPLAAIVEVPILRPDGTVLDVPGYDESTRILYLPNARFDRVPEAPTREDAITAMHLLYELVSDFPFEHGAHRSGWLAAILTPFARHAFRGPVPLFLVDANVRGAGKSKLTDVIAEVFAGRPMARTSPSSHEEEERKRNLAIAISGSPLVLIDNITGQLGNGTLDGMLTAEELEDRKLGGNEIVRIPLVAIWYATGNNVSLKADTARRVCHIRLASPDASPEKREGFLFADLLGHVQAHRADYVRAALTILRAYAHAGRPQTKIESWGSFEAWSRVIRQAIVWLGEPDPAEARRSLEAIADTEGNSLADLLAGWQELLRARNASATGLTIAEGLAELADDQAGERYARLRSALAELVPAPPGKPPSTKSVGMKFHHLRARWAEGVVAGQALCLDHAGAVKGTQRWIVRSRAVVDAVSSVSSAPPGRDYGTSGTTFLPPEEKKSWGVNNSSSSTRSPEPAETSPSSPVVPPTPRQLDFAELAARIAQATGDDLEAVRALVEADPDFARAFLEPAPETASLPPPGPASLPPPGPPTDPTGGTS